MSHRLYKRRTLRITRHTSDNSRDVAEEIAFHIDMRTEELIGEGMDPVEARRAAEDAFGNRREIEADCRRIDAPHMRRKRWTELFESVAGDVLRALREMRRRPGFTLMACLTLAVCVALNTAVWSVVDSIVLEPLPYPSSERLVTVFNSYPAAGTPRSITSVPDFLDRRERVPAFEEVALYQERTHSMGQPGAIYRDYSMIVTPSFFRVLGVEPFLGSTFDDEDTRPGRSPKAVIGYGPWQELFGGDREVLGRKLRIEGVEHTVIGVMPEKLTFPGWDVGLWLPQIFTEDEKAPASRLQTNYDMIALLRPGATVDQAQEQLAALDAAILAEAPPRVARTLEESGYTSRVVGFHDDLVRDVEPWLFLLWGGAIFVLLIGGVSLTNLLLARSSGRLRELATRYVLGASRVRIARQLVTESLVLGLAGGASGLLVGIGCLRFVDVFEVYEIPRVNQVSLDPAAAATILLLALGVMTAASTLAALAIGRQNLSGVLRAGASTGSRRDLRLRGALATVQIAVACVLLVGAVLMAASLQNLLAVDPGFDDENVLAGALSLPREHYETPEARHRFFDAVLTEIRSLPGVEDAALATQLPFSGMSSDGALTPEGFVKRPGESRVAHLETVVSDSFFSTVGIPLLAGRTFRDGDDSESPSVMIVSEEVAKRYWNGVDDALGRRVYPGIDPGKDATWWTVVGVVGDVIENDLTDPSRRGAYYLPHRQTGIGFARLVVKTEGNPLAIVPDVRERIFALDGEIALFWVTTLAKSVQTSLISFRIPAQLLLLFAMIALLLAAVGVYGVLAQSVVRRAKEIAVRMALGSSREGIYRWVLGGMARYVVTGLALGLAGALSLTHLMDRLLFEVEPTEPVVFLAVVLVIGTAAFAAAMIPARRAMRIEPVEILATD